MIKNIFNLFEIVYQMFMVVVGGGSRLHVDKITVLYKYRNNATDLLISVTYLLIPSNSS